MANKRKRSIHAVISSSVFNVKCVSASDKWFWLRPVAIKSVYGHFLFLPVNRHAFVKPFLIKAKPFVGNTEILVFALNDLHSVSIELFDRTHHHS